MAVSSSSTRLGCGRDIDEVWASIDRPPTPHELTCEFCQHARADLSRLAEMTVAQRRDDIEDPELQPSPEVLHRILDIARAEVRRGRRLPLDEAEAGRLVANLTVSEQAVAAVVRHVGDTTPEVQVRRVRVELVTERGSLPDPDLDPDLGPPADGSETSVDAAGAAGTRPARVAISLQISIAASAAVPVVSQTLRRDVMGAVENEVGMIAVKVDITVEDVHDV